MEIIDDDDHLQKKLDLEFRRILRVIKPYIPCIMNNDYLFSYRMWLEKLSESDTSEKSERNRYLIELCRQIQDGILEKPFKQLPNPGPLPPFQNDLESNQPSAIIKNTVQNVPTKDSNGKVSHYETNNRNSSEQKNAQILQNDIHLKNINFVKPPGQNFNQNAQHKKRNRLTVLKETKSNNNPKLDLIWRVPESFKEDSPSQCTSNLNHPKQKVYLDDNFLNLIDRKINDQQKSSTKIQEHKIQKKINSYYAQKFNEIMSQQNNPGIKLRKDSFENDSSWYDLSDVSSSTVSKEGFGDSERILPFLNSSDQLKNKHETSLKMNKVTSATSNLQSRSSMLNENATKFQQDVFLRNSKAETSMHCLADEVKSLKNRLKELTDIKTSLKNKEVMVSSQWQNKVNTLNKKLNSSQNHIIVLKSDITALEKKLDEFASLKQKELACLRDKLTELHNKEIDMLKEHHVKQMTNIESRFNQLINEKESEFAQKQNSLKKVHDIKLAEIGKEYELIIQQRNNEIRRLESMVENKCKRMHEEVRGIRSQMEESSYVNNDNNLEKIVFLQKCIGKMDKLFKKSERDYNKQVVKLRQEVSIRDKSLQLQLAAQKAELVSISNSNKQEEIDSLVSQLEERYKNLLENQQTYFLNEKQQDTNLITELRSMIAKTCGVDYDSFGPDM